MKDKKAIEGRILIINKRMDQTSHPTDKMLLSEYLSLLEFLYNEEETAYNTYKSGLIDPQSNLGYWRAIDKILQRVKNGNTNKKQ